MPRLARASSITFAQFSEAGAGGNLFAYLDNGPGNNSQFGTDNGTFGSAIPVNFTYLTVGGSLPADLTGNQGATLSMTSTTTSTVSTTAIPALGVTIGGQQFPQILSDTISITRDMPAAEGTGTKTNLLTVTFSAQLIGSMGGRTPQYSADTGLNFTVNYSSDFLTFNDTAEKDFSLTFSSWTNVVGGGGLALNDIDNFFVAATASGTGTFDATATAVPEPAAWLLGAIGLLSMVVIGKRFQPCIMVKCPVRR